MSKPKKILFILEGKNDEPDLIEKIMKIFYSKAVHNYAVCEQNIHMLIAKMKDKRGNLDKNLDIKLVLQEGECDEEKIKILKDDYTDIIIVFDLDPQNNITEYENIRLLLDYFNDSTEHGKLFINYPMMQAYKHLKKTETIEEFCNKKVEILDGSDYKDIVDKESDFKQISKYNFKTIMHLLNYTLRKTNFLLSNSIDIMSPEEYGSIEQKDIFNKEMEFVEQKEVSVLNTLLLFVVDYNPKNLIKKIKNNT